MSPIKKETIKKRLKNLQEVIEKLEECKKAPRKDFLKDYRINDIAKYNLIIGIENIIDIGGHILSEVFQKQAEDYAEIIEKLGEVEVISKKFAKENVDMARFRNLLIHEYIKVDLEKVYQYLQKAPDIFRKFAKAFQGFLDKI